jgi:hypothetical protein
LFDPQAGGILAQRSTGDAAAVYVLPAGLDEHGQLLRQEGAPVRVSIVGVTSATVKKHLEHIYEKLGVANRTAASTAYLRACGASP